MITNDVTNYVSFVTFVTVITNDSAIRDIIRSVICDIRNPHGVTR